MLKFTLSPDPDGQPGCYIYRAREGDSLGMLAEVWMVPVDELVANNSATLADLDEPLKGKFLTVCGGEWVLLCSLQECGGFFCGSADYTSISRFISCAVDALWDCAEAGCLCNCPLQ
jgi:hypothetical protein